MNDGRYPVAASYGEDYLRAHPNDTEFAYAVSTVYAATASYRTRERSSRASSASDPNRRCALRPRVGPPRQQGDALLDADQEYREYIRLEPNGQYAEAARSLLLKSVP